MNLLEFSSFQSSRVHLL